MDASEPVDTSGTRRLVAGNWKMNGDRASARVLGAGARAAATGAPDVEVVVFPPFPLLPLVADVLDAPRGAAGLGGQSCHGEPKGAHTGSVSAAMLVEAGCTYVLCGHSETRRELAYDDVRVRASFDAAWRAGLRPILCVGETRDERDAGRAREVVERQLGAASVDRAECRGRFDVAYEPVWAIGTGRNASPDQAFEVHGWIRACLATPSAPPPRGGSAPAAPPPLPPGPRSRILYGGSVAPDNIAGFLSQPGVDGVLVGGMSLDASSFAALVSAARSGTASRRRP